MKVVFSTSRCFRVWPYVVLSSSHVLESPPQHHQQQQQQQQRARALVGVLVAVAVLAAVMAAVVQTFSATNSYSALFPRSPLYRSEWSA